MLSHTHFCWPSRFEALASLGSSVSPDPWSHDHSKIKSYNNRFVSILIALLSKNYLIMTSSSVSLLSRLRASLQSNSTVKEWRGSHWAKDQAMAYQVHVHTHYARGYLVLQLFCSGLVEHQSRRGGYHNRYLIRIMLPRLLEHLAVHINYF